MAKKRKLEKPLLFSTYRDRSAVYGEGNNSGNDVCNMANSIDEDFLTPSLCFVCATTRGDPLLQPLPNRLGIGRDYYLEYCGNPFEEQGSTGFISRSPALFGLYLEKVNRFYEAHEEHVYDNQAWMMTEGKFPIYHPAILHVEFWGSELEYPEQIITIANELTTITDQQIEQGLFLSPQDYNAIQKSKLAVLLRFLETKPNWDIRKEAIERYEEEANKIGTYRDRSILPITQDITVSEDTNLDEFFSPFSMVEDDDEEIPF